MMITEGKGSVAPAPHKVRVDDGSLQVLLREAKRRAKFRGYALSKSNWQQGLTGMIELGGIGTLYRDERPIFAGSIGEYAVASAICSRMRLDSLPIDLALKNTGDGGIDLAPYGLTAQIKTCQREDGKNLVRCRDDRGNVVCINARVCVFCHWNQSRDVFIRGWLWTGDVDALPEVMSSVSDHKNRVVAPEMLLPFSSLIDELTARKLLLYGTN